MNNERIEKINKLLEQYYESEDSFEQTDLAITLIQGHMSWLIKQNEQLEEYIGQLKHENNLLYGRLNQICSLAEKRIE
jgi:hypothetical protein